MTGPLDDPLPLTLDASDPEAFAARLGESFVRYGFASVSDFGVPQALIDDALERARAFFASPEDVKAAYHAPGGGGARGFTPFGVETAKGASKSDLKEFWHTGRELPADHPYARYMPPNLWPEKDVPGFRRAVYGLYESLDRVGLTLLRAIARFLKLPGDFFDAKVDQGNSVLRLLHYPPVDGPGGHVRAGAHEDINVITLLLGAEEAGLEILTKDGGWLPINPPPGAMVVNIGDMLQRLTNHALPSTTHRVVNPSPERARFARFSTPFFLHFRPDFLIRTLPSCVGPGRADRYPEPITADGYLQQRLAEIKLK